jgi:SAM-dependent methyltransferase
VISQTLGTLARRWLPRAAQRSREELHDYWRDTRDAANAPELYVGEKESQRRRSEFLVELVSRHVATDERILELGCNVGRNLHYLAAGGYRYLVGLDINERALALARSAFPDTAGRAQLISGPVEEIVTRFSDGEFGLVFTMAVLEHIHTTSEFVFAEMARIGRALITIEDERSMSERHFPRNYADVFTALGLRELEHHRCETHGLPPGFVARVFSSSS